MKDDEKKVSVPAVPRARAKGLLTQELSEELLVYDLDNNQAHCLNKTAALIWKHCDGKMTVSQIASFLETETKLRADADVVLMACVQLAKSNLMEDQIPSMWKTPRLTRRDVMHRIGSALAVSLPVVSSIIAPKAVEAANCLTSGQPCTTSAQCCSGVCNAGSCS